MTQRIRVVLGEDHNLVREGLELLLSREADIEVVAQASTGDDALKRIDELRPDVALLDVSMPGTTGIEVTRRVRDMGLRTAVVLVSVHGEREVVESGLDAGASGYVVKEGAGRELVAAVRAAAQGDVYLSPRVADVLKTPREALGREPDLTPRERDVLRLLATGLTSKEIAARLGISTKTVEGHRAAMMDKLAIRHVAGLVKYAILHHIASLE